MSLTSSSSNSSLQNQQNPPQSSLIDALDTSSVLKMLGCPICQEVPEPPILMCVEGHSICHKCRQRVPSCPVCQSDFSSARNLLAEQLVLKLNRKCTFSKEGCFRTIPAKDWEMHLANCDYRQVECDLQQGKTCAMGTKMNYKTYFKHLQNVHGVPGIKGTTLNVTQFVTFEQSRLQTAMPRGVWPVQYMEAFNEMFLTGTAVVQGKIYWWVYVIGGQDISRNYVSKISLTMKAKGYELSWVGPVHSFRTPPDSILEQGMCLLATPETLYPFTYQKLQQNPKGQLLASQEGQSNVGWNVTFSLIRRDKVNIQGPSLPKPTPKPSGILSDREINFEFGNFAGLKLENLPQAPAQSNSSNGLKPKVKQEPTEPKSPLLFGSLQNLSNVSNVKNVKVKSEPKSPCAAQFQGFQPQPDLNFNPLQIPKVEKPTKKKNKMKKGKSTGNLNLNMNLSVPEDDEQQPEWDYDHESFGQ